MIELIDGKAFEDGRERFELTEWELDLLITQQYGGAVPTSRDWSRRQTSWGGCQVGNIDWFQAAPTMFADAETCEVTDKVYEIGGQRLLTLYCNHFNFQSAALDLGIKYGTLIKWYQRWKARAIKDGLRPEHFGLRTQMSISE